MKEILKMKWLLLLTFIVIIATGCSSGGTKEGEPKKQVEEKDATNETNEANETPKQGGELTVGYYSDASSFDPLKASSGGDESILYLVYDTLINYGPKFEPLPGLVESWDNKDNETWVLHLQEDVTFHDGTAFDAEAVKFNIERANSEDSNKKDLEMIESVEVMDPYTVVLHLNEPNSGLLQSLMTAVGMIVSPEAVAKYGDEYTLHPTGTGPYKLVNRIPNNELQFEKFNEYWQDGKPYLDKVTVKVMQESTMINALKSGEIQVAAPISAVNMGDLENATNIKVDASPSLNFQYIFINTSLPPLDNKDVRLAMQYAINREQIVEAIQFGNGEVASGLFPKSHPAYLPSSVIPYDPEKAKLLLKDSGVKDLSFDMLVKPDAFDVRIAEAVRAQLAEVGMTVNVKPTEVTKLVELAFSKAEYPATLARAAGRPDPNALISLYFGESSFYNPGKHANPDLAALIQKAAEETDDAERMKLLAESNQIVMQEDAMGIPIFFEPMIVATSDKVKGYEPHQYGKARFPFLWLE